MSDQFDAIIVGSGFGGSVMAYRLAEAGFRVVLLERGKSYPPGSFPRSPRAFSRNFWDPSEGLQGLYDVWSFKGSEAVVCSGLGGGSLIYANVLIRKPEEWFYERNLQTGVREPWPITRRELDPHYDRVERVLGGQAYPFEHAPYDQTKKTRELKWAAEQLGLDWYLPKLAVTFGNDPARPAPGELIHEKVRNYHNTDRYSCRLCGECDVGCNYGSKNTLDLNYLTLAHQAGCEIRTRSEVKALRPRPGGGFEVDYAHHDPSSEGRKTATARLPLTTVAARFLILSAGTFGSTYILLKNRNSFPRLSPRLGERFSTNGDLLTFAAKCSKRDSHGSSTPRALEPSRGPVITSTIHSAGEGPTAEKGFYLQDAGYPEFANWALESFDTPGRLVRAFRYVKRRVEQWITGQPVDEISGEIADIFGNCELSDGTMPLLGMGRDTPDGRMSLRRGRDGKDYLDVDWHNIRSASYFDRLTDISRRIAEKLGGTFVENPDSQYLGRMVTVHPLGGCSMGTSAETGVVNSFGEVFNYDGLYVADGSVMPGPTGSNPSLTIAAVADRFADRLIERHPR